MRKKKEEQPNVHKDLKDFDIKVNPFGELKSNLSIDRINEFLNKHVPDKRLTDKDEDKLEEE